MTYHGGPKRRTAWRAVYTHLSSGIGSPLIAVVCLVVLAVVAWLRRQQALGLSS